MLICTFESERETIRKRQKEGVAAARQKGIVFGRPVKTPPDNFNMLIKDWEKGILAFEETLKLSGLKKSTFYRRLKELRVRRHK